MESLPMDRMENVKEGFRRLAEMTRVKVEGRGVVGLEYGWLVEKRAKEFEAVREKKVK